MTRPLLIFSQSDYLIQVVDTNSNTEWQTVQIQISWLLQKPTDLDLHCLQRQNISGFSRTRVKTTKRPIHEQVLQRTATRMQNKTKQKKKKKNMSATTTALKRSVLKTKSVKYMYKGIKERQLCQNWFISF